MLLGNEMDEGIPWQIRVAHVPGWLFMIEGSYISNLNHHPVCAFGASTPPGQEGQSL
jgi:hypothetical protein